MNTKIIGYTLLIILITYSISTTFNYAYAVDNNCQTNIIHIIQLRPTLGCIEDRLDALENAPAGGESTVGANVGTGSQIFKDGNVNLRSVLGSADISVTQQADTITVDYNGTGSETTNCNNVGTGNALHVVGSNCNAKSLIAGTNINIADTTDDYTISVTGITSDDTTCANVGGFVSIYKDGECNFKTLDCDLELSCTSNTNDINIDVDTIGQQQVFVAQSTTKTNIGTSYIDIYATLWDIEEMVLIHPNNVTYFYISFQYDYVGTGTHQCRFVNTQDNSNVLYESTTFTVDQNSNLSGWFLKPAWATSLVYSIEMQCKSTNGADDPIVKGYIIYAK